MERGIFLSFGVIFSFFIIVVSAKTNVIDINEDNWKQILEEEWMVQFFAPWCPACKGLYPIWNEFSEWSKDLGIKVGQVDVTTSPGLSGRFMVTALPTIFHVINGEFRQYRGTREKSAFMSFIEEKKWQNVESIPSWKSPSSIQMSVISWFFKLSQILRGIHNQLMVDYGLPTWGSYLIFALATIMLGALLGLVLVCIIDFVYPPKAVQKPKTVTSQKDGKEFSHENKDHGDDLPDEDIKDDLVDDVSNSEPEKNSDVEQKSDDSDREDKITENKEQTGSPNVRKRKSRKAE